MLGLQTLYRDLGQWYHSFNVSLHESFCSHSGEAILQLVGFERLRRLRWGKPIFIWIAHIST